ncbi:MAG: ABC transporter permease, partial [Clostridium sp.]|nr:ABC transporter permease [Clostridium sp.]
MNLVKIEFNKIQKSRIGKILIPAAVLVIIVYSLILMSTQSQIASNFEYMVGVLNNINMFGIMMFITVYCTALLFANEFENRIGIYVSIRHTPIRKIYISRILAIMLYVLIIYLLEFIVLFVIGAVKYGMSGLASDLGIGQSFIKVFLLMIEMWMSNLFIIAIGILASVIIKNQV